MTDLLTALALLLVIEGSILALFPAYPWRVMEMLSQVPPEALRIGGLCAALLGLFGVWLLRG